MRISGGILAGRPFKTPRGSLRPTKEQVREALFASLGERTVGSRVLDLYAGSGALGLEAWSRGAAHVCFVERDRRVLQTLQANVRGLCGQRERPTRCAQGDVMSFLEKERPAKPYDIVLADPPYDRESRRGLLEKTLRVLGGPRILASDGMLVFEQSAAESAVEVEGWRLSRDKAYGDTRLLIYVRDPS